jgi:hypothetical protein
MNNNDNINNKIYNDNNNSGSIGSNKNSIASTEDPLSETLHEGILMKFFYCKRGRYFASSIMSIGEAVFCFVLLQVPIKFFENIKFQHKI